MNALNIVFAGTPAFALPTLDAIERSRHNIAAVYTQPDRPAGRGRKLLASEVKTWALSHKLPVYQPLNFKSLESQEQLKALAPDLMLVIAYGLILPPAVLAIPRLGCLNVHASLLPRWRGASPIVSALLHGDELTGVSLMQMDEGMDTGPVYGLYPCPIAAQDTAATLHDRLAQMAASPLIELLDKLAQAPLKAAPQEASLATYAAKINKADAGMNWQCSAKVLDRMVRAYNPWPVASFTHQNQQVRVHEAQLCHSSFSAAPGTILSVDSSGLLVATAEDALLIRKLQCPGGKVLSLAQYLNANKLGLRPGLQLQ